MPPTVPSLPPIESIAVLVVSCDRSSDLWSPFFALFRRFWPDCPFPIYLVSNRAGADTDRVTSIRVGEDTSWSTNLRIALCSIKEGYVMMFVDDLFLLERVDTKSIVEICGAFLHADGNCLKLNPTVQGGKGFGPLFDVCAQGAAYRVSTVLTLWKKDILDSLLRDGETAWQFEISGSERSDRYDGFYAAKTNHFEIVNGVVKGRWSRRAFRQVSALTDGRIDQGRQVMSRFREFMYQVALIRSRILYRLPAGLDRRVLTIFRRVRGILGWRGYGASPGKPKLIVGRGHR